MRKLTNQSRLDIIEGGHTKMGAEIEHFRHEGQHRAAALDSVRKLMRYLSTKACQAILSSNPKSNFEPVKEHDMSP